MRNQIHDEINYHKNMVNKEIFEFDVLEPRSGVAEAKNCLFHCQKHFR
jgi:hypothetical protein